MYSSDSINFYDLIKDEMSRVKSDLGSIGESDFPDMTMMLRHVLKSIGKGTRPALTILSSKFHEHESRLPILMACAVELLHIATLVHDDTVDKAAIRRGQPTISSRWGENAAVLIGDYLFAKSATFVCDTENVRVIRIFSETIMHLSSGELKERLSAYDWSTDREKYYDRIWQKTASLFTTSAETGAILSGAPEAIVTNFHTYGYSLGMAFQIVDDILDFQGTESEVGKPVGNDLAQGILTLPAILLHEKYPKESPIKAVFQSQGDSVSVKRAVEMINNSSAIEDSYKVATDFCNDARTSIASIPDNPYHKILMELTEHVLERKH